MKVISFNANGIRAAARKGFFEWLATQNADILCVQELKAQHEQLNDGLFNPQNYHRYCSYAEKKGYSGVAIYSRQPADKVIESFDYHLADHEGRFVQINLGKLSIVSVYLPSGSSGDERQTIKYQFLHAFEQWLKKIRKQKREYIICGDWNIVHKEIDIKNWKGNQKNSGCLPEERAWLDNVFGSWGFTDAFREINTQAEQYTWWSNRGKAREKNVGWRIDYQVVTPGLKNKILSANVYKEVFFSDHAPLTINFS